MSDNGEDPCLKAKTETTSGDENDEQENDPHYEPVISLPETKIPTLEEEEIVMVNLRARIYRYDSQENPPEWKERGTGNIKILHHKMKGTARVVMRRDKTLKLCANHFITPQMDLKPTANCDRAWMYFVKADYIDESAKSHLLAVKFSNIENAQKWKDAWDEAKKIVEICNSSENNETVKDEKKAIPDATLKLNDTFDEEKKNNSLIKEGTDQNNLNEKESNSTVTEKMSALNIKETDLEKSS